MQARKLILASAVAAMAVPAAWSQQTSEEAATAQREAEAAAAIEAQVRQTQAQQAQAQAQRDRAEAQAQVAQAQEQIQSAEREMAAARAQLERAAREVAIQARRAAVSVDEEGRIRFNGGPGTPWVTFVGQGRGAQLGAALVDAENGAEVTVVTPEGAADDAGLQVGDVIVSIDGVDFDSAVNPPAVAVMNRLAAIEPGATVELIVERDGTERSIDVVTEEGTASPFVFTTRDGQQIFMRNDRIARTGELFAERSAAAGGRGGPVVLSNDGSADTMIRLFNWAGAPWGDMELVPITPELGRYFQTTEGLLVARAPSDDSVGLQDGDVILTIGGREPTSAEHAIRILGSFEPGEVVEFSLMRDGRRQPLQYTVDESAFRFNAPGVTILPSAPPAPATPGARGRGPTPAAPATPAPAAAEPVSPTSL